MYSSLLTISFSITFKINFQQATPDGELEHSTTLHANGLETSSLSLKFVVSELHFRGGNMKLKCTATISRIYTMSNEELVFGMGLRQQTSGLHITENMSHGMYRININLCDAHFCCNESIKYPIM